MSQNYKLVQSVDLASGDIPIRYYVNEVTGIRVAIAAVESPIVKGDLVFATEAFDDDGLPHTLEHLVFLGSDDYPYKGVLDLLASKCFADGTNAYTETDHTDYMLRTAGSEGFLQILPVYLDHLLFPTLTDSAYNTEVHHINGVGEDAGVVYCEMKARECSGESRGYLEMLRSLYPGASGYKSETGGICANLRHSTSNEKVRAYHKQYYHSKNLCIIITGPVQAEQVFDAIKVVDDKIVARNMHNIQFDRPWQSPIPPLPSSVNRTIQFSSETDDEGLIYVGWRGPSGVSDYKELYVISLLLDYLNSTAVAPIQKEFVECKEPYCSTIHYGMLENFVSSFYLTFESVGKEYLDKCLPKLLELITKIWKKDTPFDMTRMKTIISRKVVRLTSVAETSPHSLVASAVIGEFLLGNNDLAGRCAEIEFLNQVVNEDEQYWLDALGRYFVGDDARYVCIVCEPSSKFMEIETNAEQERLKKQKEDMHDKLNELATKLKKDEENNSKPAPQSILGSIKTPSIENIKFHNIERNLVTNFEEFRLQFDSVKTSFINIHILVNTSDVLTRVERMYLSLISEILLELPIMRSGKLVPYETIVNEIYSNTVSYGTSIGLSSSSHAAGSMSSFFCLAVQIEVTKYEQSVKLLQELLYQTVFDPERIKTVATRTISDIQSCKKSGSKVANCVMNAASYQSNSNKWASNFMRQQKFLKKLMKDIKENEQNVVQMFNDVRNKLVQPGNLLVHLTLDKRKVDVSSIKEPWIGFVPESFVQTQNSNKQGYIDLKKIGKFNEMLEMIDEPKSCIVGVGSIDSNYMHQNIKSINDFDHPDLAAMYVLLQYLNQTEGPLYSQVRGLGLSYHVGIHLSPADGFMSLLIYKSSQLVDAYKKTIEVIVPHCKGVDEYDENMFAAAKSSLVFDFIKSERSPVGKSLQSLIAWLRDISIDFNKQLIAKVTAVTKEDLKRVAPLHLKPLIEDSLSQRSVICCKTSKINEMIESFAKLGRDFVRVKLEEEAFINSIE